MRRLQSLPSILLYRYGIRYLRIQKLPQTGRGRNPLPLLLLPGWLLPLPPAYEWSPLNGVVPTRQDPPARSCCGQELLPPAPVPDLLPVLLPVLLPAPRTNQILPQASPPPVLLPQEPLLPALLRTPVRHKSLSVPVPPCPKPFHRIHLTHRIRCTPAPVRSPRSFRQTRCTPAPPLSSPLRAPHTSQ